MSDGERAAVFLDRDNTLIADPGYLSDPCLVRLLPGAAAALRALREAGFLLVVVSNQSGIARGLISPAEAEAVHGRFVELLAREDVALDATFYCPHAPEGGCGCRKPEPGMLLRAAEQLGIRLARSFMVGDKPGDVEAGERAGCRGILYTPGAWPEIVARITGTCT